jgi:hypothetical protein
VLWNVLADAGLVTGKAWPRMFGNLLPVLRDAFERPEVPEALSGIVLPLIAETIRWHEYRSGLVHDLLATGWGEPGHVQSVIRRHPPRPMAELAECGQALRSCGWRLRGVWIVAPWWLDGKRDSWETAEDMRSWTRVAMGHIATDVPHAIVSIPGPAPGPPGGWDAVIAAEVAKREAEDARSASMVIDVSPESG